MHISILSFSRKPKPEIEKPLQQQQLQASLTGLSLFNVCLQFRAIGVRYTRQ